MKTKGTGKREQGTGENKTFNNPRLVLMNLCYATTSVWNVYDAISVMASKNRLILTSKERRAISSVTSDLLNCYVELDNMMYKRMSGIAETAEPLRFKEYDADSSASSQRQCGSRKDGCDSRMKSVPREPLPDQLLKRLRGRISDWDALADRFYKAREEDRMRILCEALGIKLRSATKERPKCR